MKMSPFAFVVGAVFLSASIANSAPTLFDSFESANLSAPDGPSPALNTSGFYWGQTNYTSIVGMVNGQPTRVWTGTATNDIWAGHDFNCFEGTYCLRFRYIAGNNMAEQRFFLGRHYPELWVRYWIRVPTNYYQGGLNNKFAAFWTNVYDDLGDVTWQTRPTSGGSAKLVVSDGGTSQPETDAYNGFISVPADRGRWMQVVYRMIPASSSTARDGILQFYRRWSNEENFTLLYNKTNARFHMGGQGIHQGYLMGWANDPYKEETEWLLDGFTVSATSLLNDKTTGGTTVTSPPSAPALKVEVQ